MNLRLSNSVSSMNKNSHKNHSRIIYFCSMMTVYKNVSGASGITHYEMDEDYIAVKFAGESHIYYYSSVHIPRHHIEKMKMFAVSGKGLASYINRNPEVRNNAVRQ